METRGEDREDREGGHLQDVLMVAVEGLERPLHIGDLRPPGDPPSHR